MKRGRSNGLDRRAPGRGRKPKAVVLRVDEKSRKVMIRTSAHQISILFIIFRRFSSSVGGE